MSGLSQICLKKDGCGSGGFFVLVEQHWNSSRTEGNIWDSVEWYTSSDGEGIGGFFYFFFIFRKI